MQESATVLLDVNIDFFLTDGGGRHYEGGPFIL